MKLLRTALANRHLALLEGAWAAASLGTWAFTIVIALHAYDVGGATAVGLAVLVRMLPSAVLAPYVALVADQRSRRSVLFATTLARAALMAAMGIAVYAGAPFAAVLALAGLFTVAGTAHKPAQAALMPQFARTPAELAAANVGWSTIDSIGFLTGSLLAGILVASSSVELAFGACGIPFLVAAAVLLRLPADARPEPLTVEQHVGGELLEGFRTVAADRRMALLVGVFGADMLVQAMVDVLLVVAALELLDLGESGVGWLSAAWGAGGLVGGMAAAALLGRGRLASGVAVGCVVAGVPLSVMAATTEPALALGLLVVLGVGYAVLEVALLTLTQRLASDDVLARVFGVEETVYVVATGAGSLAAAGLVSLVGIATSLLVVGLGLPLVALVLRRPLSGFEAGAQVPERAFGLLRSLPMFAPLPIATLENLAVRAHTRAFAAGDTVVEQGAEAHGFFVIDDGEVEVFVDGAPRRRQGPGDCFGEIALLHDCERTATVRAATTLKVLVLGRDEFLSGIGSHARSTHEAQGVATARLHGLPVAAR